MFLLLTEGLRKRNVRVGGELFFFLFLTRNVKFSLMFQLKHCSRYIHDLFPSLIKNLDPVPLRHVLNLVSGLHPNAHTEQVTR